MGFLRPEYWRPFPSLGDLPDPRMESVSSIVSCVGRRVWLPLAPHAAAAAKLLQLCPTLCDPMTAAYQAPLSLGFSRQEYWSGFPFPSPMGHSKDIVVIIFGNFPQRKPQAQKACKLYQILKEDIILNLHRLLKLKKFLSIMRIEKI